MHKQIVSSYPCPDHFLSTRTTISLVLSVRTTSVPNGTTTLPSVVIQSCLRILFSPSLVVSFSTTCTLCAVLDGGSRVTRDNVSQAPRGVPDILFLASSLVVRYTPFVPASYCSFVIAIPSGQYSGASERLSTLNSATYSVVVISYKILLRLYSVCKHFLSTVTDINFSRSEALPDQGNGRVEEDAGVCRYVQPADRRSERDGDAQGEGSRNEELPPRIGEGRRLHQGKGPERGTRRRSWLPKDETLGIARDKAVEVDGGLGLVVNEHGLGLRVTSWQETAAREKLHLPAKLPETKITGIPIGTTTDEAIKWLITKEGWEVRKTKEGVRNGMRWMVVRGPVRTQETITVWRLLCMVEAGKKKGSRPETEGDQTPECDTDETGEKA